MRTGKFESKAEYKVSIVRMHDGKGELFYMVQVMNEGMAAEVAEASEAKFIGLAFENALVTLNQRNASKL